MLDSPFADRNRLWTIFHSMTSAVRQILLIIKRIAIVIGIAIAFSLGLLGAIYLSLRSSETRVPDIVGKDRTAAETTIEDAGLNFRVRATRATAETKPDIVLIQLPAAGVTVKVGQTVAVDISRASANGEATSPASANDNASSNQNQNTNSPSSSASPTPTPKKRPSPRANDNANANRNQNRNANANSVIRNSNGNSTHAPTPNIIRDPISTRNANTNPRPAPTP
jgi:beta-lactam-binding protein with PASTA domain